MWWKTIISSVIGFFASGTMGKIKKCLPAIVVEVEKAMLDKVITADERKSLAMSTVNTVATEFGISIGPILRWVISTMIDNIAKKLPSKDVKIPDIIISVSKKF